MMMTFKQMTFKQKRGKGARWWGLAEDLQRTHMPADWPIDLGP